MAYQDIPENPQFNRQIQKIETTDLVHADIMNEILSKMLESDVFLKAFAEGLAAKIQEHVEKKEIHVTTMDKTAWNETYQQSTGYTDQKIAELINGAPETLDTLKEIADAMAENNTVVEALDTAIGQKADAAEFETLQKKYYSMVGNNDISSIGDGTLTGAISSLNTDMLKACIIYCKNSDDNHVLFIGDIPLRYQGLVKGCIASTLGYWGNLSVGSIQISSTKIQIETNAQDTNIYTVPFSCVFILG